MINTNRVKARIVERGLTYRKVAEDMGINYTTLSLKLRNKRDIYLTEVSKLCKILGIHTKEELLYYFNIDFLILS